MTNVLCPKCEKNLVNRIEVSNVSLSNKEYNLDLLTCGWCHTLLGIIDAEASKTIDSIFLKV